MLKNLLLLSSVLSFLVLSAFGQEIDTQTLRCQYKLTYVEDSLNSKDLSEDLMVLELGKSCSKFYSYYAYVKDSVSKADLKAGLSSWVRIANIKKLGNTGDDAVLYKNYPAGKVTTVDKIASDYYNFQEDLLVPQWQIKLEYDTILGYRCQKAVCTFKGRSYVAWFAQGIPVNDGPWHFSGLPGLILKAGDTRNHYQFQCVGMQAFASPIHLTPRKWLTVSKKDYRKVKRRYYSDPVSSIAESSGATVTITNSLTGESSDLVIPYNPIDLSLE